MISIFNWNIFCDNFRFLSSFKLIKNYNPSIICLQELPFKQIENIQTYFPNYTFYFSKDCSHMYSNKSEKDISYLVIGIKKEIIHSVKSINLDFDNENFLTRKYNFKECMSTQILTFKYKNKTYDLCNVHLSLISGHLHRLDELNEIKKNTKNKFMLCGDFNTFSHFSFNWLIGKLFKFRYGDYIINERKKFRNIYDSKDLQNVFSHKITHPYTLTQLDHILVPLSFKILNKKRVFKGLKYSDHIPLYVELE